MVKTRIFMMNFRIRQKQASIFIYKNK